jgi:hypothetical protein
MRERGERKERDIIEWFCVITEVVIPVLQATSSLSTKIPGYWTELKMRGRDWRKEERGERETVYTWGHEWKERWQKEWRGERYEKIIVGLLLN